MAQGKVIVLGIFCVISLGASSSAPGNVDHRRERSTLKATLYRKSVDPEMGGKVPESLRLRAELNQIDARGLDIAGAEERIEALKDMHLYDKASAAAPPQLYNVATPFPHSAYHELPSHPQRPSYTPIDSGSYKALSTRPSSYGQPQRPSYPPSNTYEPAYSPAQPKEPVLLKHRPSDETRDVRPLEIVLEQQTVTTFDCNRRAKKRLFADSEAHCQIYHLCHSDGKQDTFSCPYGTLFNEHIGTCDHHGATYCQSGEGYPLPDPPKPHDQYYHELPSSYPSSHNNPGSTYPTEPYPRNYDAYRPIQQQQHKASPNTYHEPAHPFIHL